MNMTAVSLYVSCDLQFLKFTMCRTLLFMISTAIGSLYTKADEVITVFFSSALMTRVHMAYAMASTLVT